VINKNIELSVCCLHFGAKQLCVRCHP